MTNTELYLVRHGEAENNVRKNYIAGRSNHFELTERGIEQSKELGAALLRNGFHANRVYSSPARRTLQTSAYVLGEMGMAVDVITEDNLQEQDVGEWAGRVATEVFTEGQLEIINTLGKDFRSPGGESFNDVGGRVRSWVDTLPEGSRTIAFTHGGPIRCLAATLHGWSHAQTYQTQMDNASVSLFVDDGTGWNLEYIGKKAEEI